MRLQMRIAFISVLFLTACGAGSANLEPANARPAPGPSTVDKSGSNVPQSVAAQAHFDGAPSLFVSTTPDGVSTISLQATLVSANVQPAVNGDLLVGLAASKKVVSPAANGCNLRNFALDALGLDGHFLNLSGMDPAGSTVCRDFLSAAVSGLKLEFTAVPLANTPSVLVPTVDVTVSNTSRE